MFRTLLQPNVMIWLMPALLIGFCLVLVAFVATFFSMRRMDKRLRAFLRGPNGASLEQMLAHLVCEIERVDGRIEAVEQAVGVLQAQMPACFQKHGLVRFNAFENVGGEQSFSLAMLDGHNNGYVLTSVYSRSEVRVYAKRVQDGRASHPLSEEEKRALNEALTL